MTIKVNSNNCHSEERSDEESRCPDRMVHLLENKILRGVEGPELCLEAQDDFQPLAHRFIVISP
jgi:hypothetical protein